MEEQSAQETRPLKVTKEKDPKKVEAGRRGAAARKSKLEQLKAELQASKHILESAVLHEDAPQGQKEALLSETAAPSSPQPEKKRSSREHKMDWTPWIVGGGTCIAGVVLYPRIRPYVIALRDSIVGTTGAGTAVVPTASQLKPADPFHME
jgi:hypothetical protein